MAGHAALPYRSFQLKLDVGMNFWWLLVGLWSYPFHPGGVESSSSFPGPNSTMSLGSVFLGDRTAHLAHFSLPTTPKSGSGTASTEVAPPIPPLLSLQLRVRLLEALVLGVKPPKEGEAGLSDKYVGGPTLFRRTEDVQKSLNETTDGNDALKRFMASCSSVPNLPSTENKSQTISCR